MRREKEPIGREGEKEGKREKREKKWTLSLNDPKGRLGTRKHDK